MNRFHAHLLLGCAFCLALAAVPLLAQSKAITLTVDARRAPLHMVVTQMDIPVQPGPLTLYYPKWIPGEHEPDGPITEVTGLKFTANGQTIPWQRDKLDVFTFHLTIPAGVHTLHVQFDYIEAALGEYTSGGSATAKLVDLSWNQNLLYPAGTPAEQLMYTAKLLLPAGWKFATALPIANQKPGEIEFQPASLNRLVDSPVISGEYLRKYNITPPGEPIHHELDVVGDSAQSVVVSPAIQKDMTNLVAETGKLFGTRHYRDYHFLFTLSDHVAHFGLEHHESDDSRLPEGVLMSSNPGLEMGEILPHEFVHSWNGKFRRPKDLTPPYYEAPMETDLLWVYEGLTDYLGNVLATRSGLWTQAEYHEWIARISAELGPGRPGRTWRPLLDTAVAVPGVDSPASWINWRRGTDYYEEGDLLWLEVDTIIHRVTHGQKSIGDFCRLFYGGPNNGPQLKTYTFDDLVQVLNQVAPYDWASFFHQRLNSTSPQAPTQGVTASGWKLIYNAEPVKGRIHNRQGVNSAYSIGLTVLPDGRVEDSVVGSPAYKAGITSGMKIAGVNSRVFTTQWLKDAIKLSPRDSNIQLLVVDNDYYKTVTVNYSDGLRYPHLEQVPGVPDYLDQILAPRAQ